MDETIQSGLDGVQFSTTTTNLLEIFPISNDELKCCQRMYHNFHHNDRNDNTETGAFPSSVTTTGSATAETTDNNKILCHIPEIRQLIQSSIFLNSYRTFTSPSTTVSLSDLCSIELCIDALLSLIGRRGSDIIFDILIHATATRSSSPTAVPSTQPSGELMSLSSSLSVNNPSHCHPVQLVQYLYQLTQYFTFLCRDSTDQKMIDDLDQKTDDLHHFQQYVSTLKAPKSWIEFVSKQLENNEVIAKKELLKWSTFLVPDVHLLVSTIFKLILFGSIDNMTDVSDQNKFVDYSVPCFSVPAYSNKSIVNRNNRLNSVAACLITSTVNSSFLEQRYKHLYETQLSHQLGLMSLGRDIHVLYSSDVHGLSFLTFQRALVSYSGSTLILIETATGDIIGYYTDLSWKQSPDWYTGDGESFLFQLYPSWNVLSNLTTMTTTDTNSLDCSSIFRNRTRHQYLNVPPTHKKEVLHGLCVDGITNTTPRFHITTSFERCVASSIGNGVNFESGSILSNDESYFDIDTLEIWAVRMQNDKIFEQSITDGVAMCSMNDELHRRCGQVDRKQFLDDFMSGAYMNQLFDHRLSTRGRADFVTAANQRQGYYVDGKTPSTNYISDN